MATVVQTIGASSRDYSTITAWEADLDNTGIYSAGDVAQGECYDDSEFTESTLLTFNGGGTAELDKMILSVAEGQRQDGTAGTGARVIFAAGGRWDFTYGPASGGGDWPMERTVEWLEVDGASNSHTRADAVTVAVGGYSTYYGQVSHMLIHDFDHTGGNNWEAVRVGSSFSGVMDCIIYDCQGTYKCVGIYSVKTTIAVANNTVYKMKSNRPGDDSDNKAYGIWLFRPPTANKNNISIGNVATYGASAQADFFGNVGTYNLSGDATATGSNSVTDESAGDVFVSTVDGSEDLHLKTSSPAIGAGDDLGTGITMLTISAGSSAYGTPVNIDIDGRDRDAEGDTWDIGADQYVAASSGGGTAPIVLATTMAGL